MIRLMTFWGGLCLLLLCAAMPARAEDFEEPRMLYPPSDLTELPFDRQTGCYVDTNSEVEFPFTVTKKGIYVFIQMGDGAAFMGGREVELTKVPGIGIPLQRYDSNTLVGFIKTKGKYVVGFGPNSAHGYEMNVRICKRVTAVLE